MLSVRRAFVSVSEVKNGRALAAAVIIAAVVVVILLISSGDQPRFEGRRLGRWLQDINRAGSLTNAEPALRAVAAMGTNSLPFLLSVISHEDSAVKQKLIWYAARANVFGLDLPFNGYLKGPVCLALKTLGTNASPIVLDLGRLACVPGHAGWSMAALFSIGTAAGPGLILACGSSDLIVRADAAMYLSKVADGSQRGWGWGWNPDASGKRQLFGVGSTIGNEEDARALAAQLNSPNAIVRKASVEALNRYCRQHRFVLSHLRERLKDENEGVRAAARDAIASIERN